MDNNNRRRAPNRRLQQSRKSKELADNIAAIPALVEANAALMKENVRLQKDVEDMKFILSELESHINKHLPNFKARRKNHV